jgi:hypothetical protein
LIVDPHRLSRPTDDTIDESIPVAKPVSVGSTWKLDADDGDLIEDDALLEKEDLTKPDKGKPNPQSRFLVCVKSTAAS